MHKLARMFLQSRFKGKRFESGQIPSDVLADFCLLGQLITEITKWRLQQEFPSSSATDIKDKISSYRIVFRGIEVGSAVLTWDLVPNICLRELLGLNGVLNCFQLARDDFIDSIHSASKDDVIASVLPQKILNQIAKIGRNLKEGESLKFSKDKYSDPVTLTTEATKHLNELCKKLSQSEPRAIKTRGFIPEVDQDKMTFHMEFADGKRTKGGISSQHFDTIILGFNGYSKRKRLLIDGRAHLNDEGRIIRWDSIANIFPPNSLDVPFSLEALKKLENGWLDGDQGVAPDHQGLDWLGNLFAKYFPDHLPLPYTYPTPDGGVQMEWTFSNVEVEFEIDLLTRKGEWLHFDTSIDDDGYIRQIELENLEDWKWIANNIESARG